MKRFNDLKIAVKLIISFIIVALIAGIIGLIGSVNIKATDTKYSALFNQYGKPLNNIGDAMSNFQRIRGNLRDIIINDGKDISTYIDNINTYNAVVDSSLSKIKELNSTKKIQAQVNQIQTDLIEFRSIQDKITELAQNGDSKGALTLFRVDGKTIATKLDDELNKLQDTLVSSGNTESNHLSTNTNNTILIMISIILVAMLVAILLGIFISGLLSKPIKKLVETADKLALGDINVDVEATTKDEIGTLMEAFKRMIANIREQALSVEKLAAGNTNIDVNIKSENDLLNKKLNEMIQTLKAVIAEIDYLSSSSVDGQLSIRGDEKKFKGDYSNIIHGINQTLDAILQPINEASDVLEEMSKGNLQVSVEGNYKGDHALIKDAINNTLDSFNEILGSINSASEQVASGSKQISTSSIVLSQGSTEQASSIEEITASIEEIASQTRQNATNADQANELATDAKGRAVQGNEQMAEMLKAMAEINDSSNNISKIIKVIDDIAFQTNILALNAAVEAARAGQHGKGFAVVAEEVRNLAARSANAAKETTAMIEGSIKKVDVGTKIANETASALNQIVDGVAKAADLVGEIAIASNEQATGIAQVNLAINQVAQVVQANSATSEESAAASEELSSQAELLKELVNKYKLKKSIVSKISTESLSPEILKMLESMAAKKPEILKESVKATEEPKKVVIALNDKDFGKY